MEEKEKKEILGGVRNIVFSIALWAICVLGIFICAVAIPLAEDKLIRVMFFICGVAFSTTIIFLCVPLEDDKAFFHKEQARRRAVGKTENSNE